MVLSTQEEKELCRFFLKGRCKFGSECRFSHERPRCLRGSRPSCIYFLEGNCFRGSNCYFLHDEFQQVQHLKGGVSPPIPDLPSEVLEMVFRRLYPEDILECLQVWKSLFEDDHIWKKLFLAHFGNYESIWKGDFQNYKDPDSPRLSSWRADYMRSLYIELDLSAMECCRYKQKIDPKFTNLVGSISNILEDARNGGFTRGLLFAVDAKNRCNSLQRAARLGLDSVVAMLLREASEGGFVEELILHESPKDKDIYCVSGIVLHHVISVDNFENISSYPSIVSALLDEATKGGFLRELLFAKNNNGCTPLHMAVGGYIIKLPEVVSSLLEAADTGGFLKELLLTEAGKDRYGNVFDFALGDEFPEKNILELMEKYAQRTGTHRYYMSRKKMMLWESDDYY